MHRALNEMLMSKFCSSNVFVVAKVNADFGGICDCPTACASVDYDVKLSYTAFPSSAYGMTLGEELNITLPPRKPGVLSYENKAQYIR